MRLEKGREILKLHHLRCEIREVESIVREVYEGNDKEHMRCEEIIGQVNQVINCLSQVICGIVGGKECQEKPITLEDCDNFVSQFEQVVENPIRSKSSVYYTGVDLGTACVVVAVLDEKLQPCGGSLSICRRSSRRNGCGLYWGH